MEACPHEAMARKNTHASSDPFDPDEACDTNWSLRLQNELCGHYAEAAFCCLARAAAPLPSNWFNCWTSCAAVSGGKARRQMRCPPIASGGLPPDRAAWAT